MASAVDKTTPLTISTDLNVKWDKYNSRVLVAIPCYNEELTISGIVIRSLQYTDKILVVDDGSKDKSAEIAKLSGAEVISHEKNFGYGAAIKTCIDRAIKMGVNTLITIDADGQHNPDDIPLLLNELEKTGADIVIGSRFVNGNGKNQKIPSYRKVGMKVLDTATVIGSGVKITDSQSGFRAYSQNALKSINLKDNSMAAGSEILIQAANNNLKIVEVPIKVRYDVDGSTYNPIAHGLNVLNKLLKLISFKRPLIFFGIPGVLLLGMAAFFCILVLNGYNRWNMVPIGYAILFLLTTIIGVFSIFTGIMLWTINNSNKN